MWIPSSSPIDVAAHVRVPAARLVAEVDSGFQQLFQACLWHCVISLVDDALPSPLAGPGSCAGQAPSRCGGVGLEVPGDCRERAEPRRSGAAGGVQRGSKIRRQLGYELQRPRRRRVDEGEPVSVEELALQAVPAGAAVGGIAERGDGRLPRSERGSGGCGRSLGVPPGSVSAVSSSSTVKWVRASRDAAPETAIRWRCREARPIGASIVPVREPIRPAASARYMRSTSRRWTAACSAAWVSSSRATTSRPLVSLSRRWTMPGRSGSSPPPRISASSPTRVGPRCEGAGMDDEPGGLVDHRQVPRRGGRREARSLTPSPSLRRR